MKISSGSMPREVRAAIVVALVAGAAALALHFGLRDTAIALGAVAVAIAAAFYLLVMRAARIPRGAVLTVRLAGALREIAPRSALDQLRGHGGAALFDLRHGRLLHRLDVRQSHELTRLERRAIDIDGDLHRALASPLLRAAARQANRPTTNGISLIFRCRLVRAGAGQKGLRKIARLSAPAARDDLARSGAYQGVSRAFPSRLSQVFARSASLERA